MKSSSEEFAGDLRKCLIGRKLMIDEIEIFHTSLHFCYDEISIIFFKLEAYEMVSCTNSSAG